MNEKSPRAQKEEEILQFWKEHKIFEKTLEKESPKGEFVFFDGPPFATGLPHAGSLLSSVVKDVVPRYKTMQGYHVRRRWGWDCHGLPIENMIEKELGIKDKTEIEGKVGIEAFNEACRASVLRYADEWKKYVDRVGRWVEYDNAYKTMDNTYIESVWNALSTMNDKGLLYEGRKVLLYCPHCQTPIAKAEIAMDNSYRDVTEESVYVKFKLKSGQKIRGRDVDEKVFLLAWTTTPWTLPGNVALAVGADVEYGVYPIGNEIYILASVLAEKVLGDFYRQADYYLKGSEMVGMEYEPLFEIAAVKESGKKAFYVTKADFVTTTDGTGIVHTAVIYGEDDYNLGLKIDLPMIQLLDQAAHFNNLAPEFIRGQYFKKAEKYVKEDLENRKLIFKKENNTHSYPHCHRCGTALLYNAISSWFINIQKIKARMIALNEEVNWVPDHLKHGRFLNIVENAPDWTISRNRYWAAPLPIWKDENGKLLIVNSLETLKKHTKKSGNKFIFVRHGEAESNANNVINSDPSVQVHLTDKGRKQAEEVARKIGRADVIYCSPYLRTKETAEIILKNIGIEGNITEDVRLRELEFGDLNGKPFTEFLEYEEKHINSYDAPLPGGESYNDAKKRIGEFLYEIDKKHQNQTIVVVTHGMGVEAVSAVIEGADLKRSQEIIQEENPNFHVGGMVQFDFIPISHNKNFELDLHRPYIDEVELVSEDGRLLKRIPEVIDGWVESASMPFAEYHYPFENKATFELRFPGDFVAEYIAQTRTWFYYMHTVAVALFDKVSFRNVVSTGNVMARDGSKMSKSKGNYTDPLLLLDQVGADAFRYYLMSSVVMQAEDMLFKDEEVKEIQNRLINMLTNSFAFYEIFADDTAAGTKSSNVLDKWILARLHEVITDVTEAMEKYDMVRASRPLKDFVTDLSTWYVRRSRDRFKGDDREDKVAALSTSRHIFKEFSKLIAPIMPFIAEEIYLKVREGEEAESVHLTRWPEIEKPLSSIFSNEKVIIENMTETRRLVSLALELRSKVNIKVRQPLSKLEVKTELPQEYLEIVKDELNVKEVVVNKNLEQEVMLDTNLTPELLEEGKMRDALRAVQEWRKEQGLKPGERATYKIPVGEEELFKKFGEEIKRAASVDF